MSMKKNNIAQNTIINVKNPVFTRLLRGGLVLPHDNNCGLIILLRGKPGTGKSTLALQILDMLDTKAKRCYCTLEQSVADIRYKLSAMLVNQAINHTRRPIYDRNTFQCTATNIKKFLKPKLKNKVRLSSEMAKIIERAKLPLYGEPDEQERYSTYRMRLLLADWVYRNLDSERIIEFFDSKKTSENSDRDGPIQIIQNRVILGLRLLEHVLRFKSSAKERKNQPIVVIDGLSLLTVSERETIEMQRLIERMRQSFQVGILVYEPNEEESTSLDHQADMVIELARHTIERPLSYLIHELSIKKARYQEAALGQHQFKIRGSGIAVFPSLHFQVHHYNYMDLELKRSSDDSWKPTHSKKAKPLLCENGSLIDLICNPQKGESIVLLGHRNSFKTQLCLDFLSHGSWGCPKKDKVKLEQGLLISLIDNAPDIERGLLCPWKQYLFGTCHGNHKCESPLLDHARSFCQRPGCITPAEFFHYISERIQISVNKGKSNVERVVFWDLTQMDYRFPLFKEDTMLLPAMMDMFKTKGLVSLFMGAGNADNTSAASAMADHVIFCWRSKFISNITDKNKTNTISSLILYVDRTSVTSRRSGKVLYRIPVYTNDKITVPLCRIELEKPEYRLELPNDDSLLDELDRQNIRKITDMQGVA